MAKVRNKTLTFGEELEFEITFSRTNTPELRQHITLYNKATKTTVIISLDAIEVRRFQDMWGVK